MRAVHHVVSGRRHAAELHEDGAGHRRASSRHATDPTTCSSTPVSTTTTRCRGSSSRSSASASPDHVLDVGSGSHAAQTARVMERLEPVLDAERPDLVLVPGDVNSTLAAALVAAKLEIPVGHIEAGLRSFDRTMPEEINRIAHRPGLDLLFTHSPEARDNLLREGVRRRPHPRRRQHDDRHARRHARRASERSTRPRSRARAPAATWSSRCTARRSSTARCSRDAIAALDASSPRSCAVVFPVHPRTRARMRRHGTAPRAARRAAARAARLPGVPEPARRAPRAC